MKRADAEMVIKAAGGQLLSSKMSFKRVSQSAIVLSSKELAGAFPSECDIVTVCSLSAL